MPASSHFTSTAAKAAAAVAAIVALALGANAVAGSGSSSASSSAPRFQMGPPPQGAQGQMPPGMGTPVTGSTLSKLTSVATAKYPGTVERAMKLPDGSYEVHVIRSSGSEVHVLISKAFEITGTQTGGPGMPPPA